MILPTLALFSIFVLYPIVASFILSFYKWAGIGPREFVGFRNYIEAFRDSLVRLSFTNNAVYSIGIIIFGVFPGLVLAGLLARNIRGRLVFQTIYFIPRLLSMVIVSVVWGWIYNPNFGILNKLLRGIGLDRFAIGWLGHPDLALWAVIVAGGWTYFGFCMVIFLAALQNLDPSLEDAALIDGASSLQIFFKVILPQITHVVTMVLIYTVIDSFKVFDIIYVMTQGGPGERTQIMATYLYRESFRHNHFGYGATIAVLLTIFVLVVSVLFQRYRERRS